MNRTTTRRIVLLALVLSGAILTLFPALTQHLIASPDPSLIGV
jgi:hypothetical protein